MLNDAPPVTAPSKPVSPARRRRAAWVLAVVLIAYGAFDMHKFLVAMRDAKPTLKRWLPYAAELGHDDQLYATHPDYLYPPFFLVLIKPLTWMPLWLAAVIWQLAKYVATVAIFGLAWDLLARAGPLPLWCKIVSVIVSVRFVASDLGHGNVNLFICLGVVLAAWLLLRNRPIAAGVLVALAAAVKLTPALWIVYLFYKRQWRALLGAAVGLVLAWEVIPLAALTPSANRAMLAAWYDLVVDSFIAEGKIYSPANNQSLAAVTNRLLGRAEWAPEETPATVVQLDNAAIKWIQRLIALALVGALAWSCHGGLPRSDPMAFAAEWSLLAPITLALSGYTWTGHFCILILAHVTLLSGLALPREWGANRLILGLTAASFCLLLLTTDIITPAGRQWASRMGLPLLGVMLTAAALVVLRGQRRRLLGPGSASPPPQAGRKETRHA